MHCGTAGAAPAAVELAGRTAATLRTAAAAASPREFVRLLAGRRAGDVVRVTEALELPFAVCTADTFTVCARGFAHAEAAARARGDEFVGFAHGHPRGPATLSAADRHELWRTCVQLVVAPAATAAGFAIAAFWLTGDRAMQLEVRT